MKIPKTFTAEIQRLKKYFLWCYFLEYLTSKCCKNSRKQNGCFLVKKKKIKRKKNWGTVIPQKTKKWLPILSPPLNRKSTWKKLCVFQTKKDSVLFCGFIINSTLLIKKINLKPCALKWVDFISFKKVFRIASPKKVSKI